MPPDWGLGGGAARGLDTTAVLKDGDLLGRLIDTFVTAQIRPELQLRSRSTHLHHLRDTQGRHEVDLIAEIAADHILAIEINGSAAPTRQGARHLTWLHVHSATASPPPRSYTTGPNAYRIDDGIMAIPIRALWG